MKNIIHRLKKILTLGAMVAIQYGNAQAVGTPYIVPSEQLIPFSFLTGGIQNENPRAVRQTTDGGYVTIATTASSASGDITGTNHGDLDMWVVKYDQDGKREWQRLYGGNTTEIAGDIIQTTDGGYIFTGLVGSSGNGDVMTAPANRTGANVWVVKIDASGNIIWQRIYGGTGSEIGKTVLQTSDGGYIIGGDTASSASGDIPQTRSTTVRDFWAIRITSTGDIIWQQTYDNPGPLTTLSERDDLLYQLVAASDGSGYFLAGFGGSNYRNNNLGSTGDYFVVKIGLTGGVVWQKLYGTPDTDTCYSIGVTSDGGCILAGYSNGSVSGDLTETNHSNVTNTDDMWVIRLNSEGNILWQRLLGGIGVDRAHSVIQTADGGFMVAGYSSSSVNSDVTDTNNGSFDVCLFKLSASGSNEWMRLYGGSIQDGSNNPASVPLVVNPTQIQQLSDRSYIIVSTSASSNTGDVTDTLNGTGGTAGNRLYDQWLFKIDETGNIILVPDVGQKD